MSTLQVKNLPDDLHVSLASRARELDMTMSEFVTRAIRRELERPTFDDWVSRIVQRSDRIRPIDTGKSIDDGRAEVDRERFDAR